MAAMTKDEKLARVKLNVGTDTGLTDDEITSYLDTAGRKIVQIVYPYGNGIESVPDKYAITQCEVATFLINKRGAEGEVSHGENGINRSYGDADIPASMLRGVVPMVGVPL